MEYCFWNLNPLPPQPYFNLVPPRIHPRCNTENYYNCVKHEISANAADAGGGEVGDSVDVPGNNNSQEWSERFRENYGFFLMLAEVAQAYAEL